MRKVANQRVTSSPNLCYLRLTAISTSLIPLFLLSTHCSLKFKQHLVTLCSASSTPAWASMSVPFLARHFLLSNSKSSQLYPLLQLRKEFQAVPAAVSMDCLTVCLSVLSVCFRQREKDDWLLQKFPRFLRQLNSSHLASRRHWWETEERKKERRSFSFSLSVPADT